MIDGAERCSSIPPNDANDDEDDDEHGQCASDVIVLNKVKRTGMCIDEDVFVSERRRSASFSNRSFASKRES